MWEIIISSIITFIAGGGLMTIVTLKQTRQGKSLDNAEKVVAKYEEVLEKYKTASEKNEQKVEELQKEVAELKRQLSVAQAQIENLRFMYSTANALRCEIINCKARKPPVDMEHLEDILGINESDEKEG